MILLLLLAPCGLAACVAIAIRPYRRLVGAVGVAAAMVSFAAAVRLAFAAATSASPPGAALSPDVWRVDALSAMLALCITFVSLLVSVAGPGFGGEDDERDPATARQLRIYTNAFAFTMLLAVTIQNVAFMWVAIEATTITSAMVIPLRRTKASVEASWKYLLICSVGIALAFAGTVLAYFDFVSSVGELPGALNWSALRAAAPSLHPELLRLAFAFTVVGYGTKAGLAPMHTWLPDAHSEAPSPISAMMSGVLLAVAMYAIARWKAVIDASAAVGFADVLLIGFGITSMVIGTFSLVLQRHYKRLLAYSSVEHMGLVSIGLALGPLGMFAAWLHVANHAVAKAASFLLAGRVLGRYQTTEIDRVTGLLRVMPWTGGLLAAAALALVGLPPFGLFVSEFLLVRAAMVTRHYWLVGTVIVLLLTACVALISHLNRMLYGDVPAGIHTGERRGWPVVALTASAALLLVLGVGLPPTLSTFIARCVSALIP